jgi:hypothetical protein
MKSIFATAFALFMIIGGAQAQDAKTDLSITAKYHINMIIPMGKCRIWPSIQNTSKSDYKDITYQVQFFAGDGTAEGTTNIDYHDYVGPGTTKKIKEQYIDCPKDCKSIVLSIVSGKKLD